MSDLEGLTEAEKNLAASEAGKTPFFKVVLTGGEDWTVWSMSRTRLRYSFLFLV
jgi:hypothetical protein